MYFFIISNSIFLGFERCAGGAGELPAVPVPARLAGRVLRHQRQQRTGRGYQNENSYLQKNNLFKIFPL